MSTGNMSAQIGKSSNKLRTSSEEEVSDITPLQNSILLQHPEQNNKTDDVYHKTSFETSSAKTSLSSFSFDELEKHWLLGCANGVQNNELYLDTNTFLVKNQPQTFFEGAQSTTSTKDNLDYTDQCSQINDSFAYIPNDQNLQFPSLHSLSPVSFNTEFETPDFMDIYGENNYHISWARCSNISENSSLNEDSINGSKTTDTNFSNNHINDNLCGIDSCIDVDLDCSSNSISEETPIVSEIIKSFENAWQTNILEHEKHLQNSKTSIENSQTTINMDESKTENNENSFVDGINIFQNKIDIKTLNKTNLEDDFSNHKSQRLLKTNDINETKKLKRKQNEDEIETIGNTTQAEGSLTNSSKEKIGNSVYKRKELDLEVSKSPKNRLPPCKVCGDVATGFHYGINSCESCFEFYRRTYRKHKVYICVDGKQCDITGDKKFSCNFCRLQKCHTVGMSRQRIKTGRYSRKKKALDALEVSKHNQVSLHEQKVDELQQIIVDVLQANQKFSSLNLQDSQEQIQVKQQDYLTVYQRFTDEERYRYQVRAGENDRCRQFRYLKNGRPSCLVTRVNPEWLENWAKDYVKFCKLIPGFRKLPISDQMALIIRSWAEFYILCGFRGFNSQLKLLSTADGCTFHFDEWSRIFGEDYINSFAELAQKLVEIDLDETSLLLLKIVVLTAPDGTNLEDREMVEQLHWTFVQCLLHQLSQTARPRDHRKTFTYIVDRLMQLRTVSQGYHHVAKRRDEVKALFNGAELCRIFHNI